MNQQLRETPMKSLKPATLTALFVISALAIFGQLAPIKPAAANGSYIMSGFCFENGRLLFRYCQVNNRSNCFCVRRF
jgi:hypothetical protein